MSVTADFYQHITFAKRLLSSLLLSVASIALIAPSAMAQSPSPSAAAGLRNSITLSPTSKTFRSDPGQSLSDELIVINDGDEKMDFIVYARPYSINNSDYSKPDFSKPLAQSDVYTWVRLPKTRYSLDAGKSVKVPYTISVPASAGPGGHYGVIFAETQPIQKATDGNAVFRKKRVGMIVYATINGDVKLAGSVEGSTIPFWQPETPLRTDVTAKNTGNTDFINTVHLTVRDVFGSTKYQIEKEYHILPGTTRKINIEWLNANWFGLYRVETGQKFLDKDVKNEGYVLMMPRYVLIAFIVIIVIGVGYAVIKRRKK